jgi:RNA recognition motif-containing protein
MLHFITLITSIALLGVEHVGTRELREMFEKYGRVLNVQTSQAGYAFIEMEDERDCLDCIRGLDDTVIDGQRITVEKAKDKGYRAGHTFI